LLLAFAFPAAVGIQPPDFQTFVFESLRLLRAGASRIKRLPAETRKVGEAIGFYFVHSCQRKIRARTQLVASSYDLSLLESWNPSYLQDIATTSVLITNVYISRNLTAVGVKTTENEHYIFDATTVAKWWTVLVRLLIALDVTAKNKAPDIMRLAILSMSTHDLLGYLPDSLWTIPSLAMHLQKCKKAEGMSALA
jgi:hypothetical protein